MRSHLITNRKCNGSCMKHIGGSLRPEPETWRWVSHWGAAPPSLPPWHLRNTLAAPWHWAAVMQSGTSMFHMVTSQQFSLCVAVPPFRNMEVNTTKLLWGLRRCGKELGYFWKHYTNVYHSFLNTTALLLAQSIRVWTIGVAFQLVFLSPGSCLMYSTYTPLVPIASLFKDTTFIMPVHQKSSVPPQRLPTTCRRVELP